MDIAAVCRVPWDDGGVQALDELPHGTGEPAGAAKGYVPCVVVIWDGVEGMIGDVFGLEGFADEGVAADVEARAGQERVDIVDHVGAGEPRAVGRDVNLARAILHAQHEVC